MPAVTTSATSTYDPVPASLDLAPFPVGVYREAQGDSEMAEPMPHLRCVRINHYEGPRPPDAEFRYEMDELSPSPTDFERLVPLPADSPWLVREDDRLIVAILDQEGRIQVLFDGFATIPAVNLGGSQQEVPLQAVGTAIRMWDSPLDGSWWRDASNPEATDNNILTALPARFNPGGKPNCTGDGFDWAGGILSDLKSPVFIDPGVPLGAEHRTFWTLDRAARYALLISNLRTNRFGEIEPGYESWVDYPDGESIRSALTSVVPRGSFAVDINNPATYERKEIIIKDRTVSDIPAPEALWDMLRQHGFGFSFWTRSGLRLSLGGGENKILAPQTILQFYPMFDPFPNSERDLYLQPPGGLLDPSLSNVQSASLQRDGSQVINSWRARMAPTRIEAAFVLYPGFEPDEDDMEPEQRKKFVKNDPGNQSVDPRKYRSWVFSETGEGYWKDGEWHDGPEAARSLDLLLGAGRYVKRRRPGLGQLLTRDDSNTPMKFRLGILIGYEGDGPEIWGPRLKEDGSTEPNGEFYWIKGGYELDPDRLGIVVTANDPDAWDIGGGRTVEGLNGGVLRLMSWLTGHNRPSPRDVALLLVCTIEGDQAVSIEAPRLSLSPKRFTIRRDIDGRDQHKYEIRDKSSPYFDPDNEEKDEDGDGLAYEVLRNDALAALADAQSRRNATAFVRYNGSVSIPRLTNLYRPGQRIRSIRGRECDLRVSAGQGSSAPMYPRIVQLSWLLDPHQRTELTLSHPRSAMPT